jgi:hypothetical protein
MIHMFQHTYCTHRLRTPAYGRRVFVSTDTGLAHNHKLKKRPEANFGPARSIH